MMTHDTTPRTVDRTSMTIRLLTTCLAALLLGALAPDADAGPTKTRFDLSRSKTFNRSKVRTKPVLIDTFVARWIGVVPPWQDEVIQIELPTTVVFDIGLDDVKDDDSRDAGIDSGIDTVIPIVEGDSQESNDDSTDGPEITANIYGHSTSEQLNRHPRDRAEDPDGG